MIAVIGLYSCSDNNAKEKKAAPVASVVHYNIVEVAKGNLQENVKLPAQLAAYQEVSIFPKVNGYVKSVHVDIGSHVQQGQLLMTLEDPELLQQTVQSKERYERAKAGYMIDKENYERLKQAAETPGAVSPMDLASAAAKTLADSSLANAEKANWQMQQALMAYLNVTAPFTGVITERNVHPGALVSGSAKDKPMLELKQVDHLRLQVDIPEAVAATLKNNDTVTFYLSAFPGKKMIAHVSRKSDNVNLQYRSERIELDVANKDGALSPGMYADVIIGSRGTIGAVVVPKTAVITSTERKYVIVVRDNKAVKTDVMTGNETADKIEVVGSINDNDKVIANASDDIKDGEVIK
jgi:RND family efflux transporter MFP subunit